MKRILKRIYLFWGLAWFAITLLAIYPIFLVIIPFPKLHKYAYYVNKIWAYFVYGMIAMPPQIVRKGKLVAGQQYVFCANHTSFLDTPLLGMIAHEHIVFMGKKSLADVPVFGYMFRNMHIAVDREVKKEGYRSVQKAIEVVRERKHNIAIYPEGSISRLAPRLAPFKDGGFRIAIEAQVPVVPVTIPYLWIVWHNFGPVLSWHKVKAIVHEPIPTEGMTLADVDTLKKKVRTVIENEMKAHFPTHFPASAQDEESTF